MEQQRRKPTRLQGYDYSQNGAYFVTICTYKQKHIFGEIKRNSTLANTGMDSISTSCSTFANTGADSISARMIANIWNHTINELPNISCPKYVVMPNHFHAIVVIENIDNKPSPTLSAVIQSFKRHSTIEYIKMVKQNILPPFDKKIWQRSFNDRIITNENDFTQIWNYIDNNPIKWITKHENR